VPSLSEDEGRRKKQRAIRLVTPVDGGGGERGGGGHVPVAPVDAVSPCGRGCAVAKDCGHTRRRTDVEMGELSAREAWGGGGEAGGRSGGGEEEDLEGDLEGDLEECVVCMEKIGPDQEVSSLKCKHAYHYGTHT
jgi:hypothetical protein